MLKQIIAFNGKAGSGKDYQSQRLVAEQGFKKYAFADKLREVGYAVLGMEPLSQEEYDKFKSIEILPGLTFRNILENLGESIRKISPDFWASACISSFKNNKTNVCVSDLRHANEYFAIKQFCDKKDIDFKLVFCNYHSDRFQEINNHPSAQLAQFLEDRGYKDGEVVDELDILVYKVTIEDRRK